MAAVALGAGVGRGVGVVPCHDDNTARDEEEEEEEDEQMDDSTERH